MARNRKTGRAPIVSARLGRPRFSDPVSLLEFQGDRRRFHPELVKPAFGVNVGATRLVLAPGRSARATLKSPIGFAVPDRVLVCVRRRRRREVIFAKGKSGGGNRRGKRNFWSKVTCR